MTEHWLAGQPWEPAPAGAGWTVPRKPHGARFRMEPVPGGVRVAMRARGEVPAEWFVPGRPAPAACPVVTGSRGRAEPVRRCGVAPAPGSRV